MQAGVRKLNLRLDPDRPRATKPIGLLGKVVQQCGLPDPRLAAHDQYTALVNARVRQQPDERLALAAPTAQPGPAALYFEHAAAELKSRGAKS